MDPLAGKTANTPRLEPVSTSRQRIAERARHAPGMAWVIFIASWTNGYATARSEAICRGAGCGRIRTSGSVGGQGQQRPWSTRPLRARIALVGDVDLQMRCQRCGALMDLTDPGPGEAWKLDQFWICLECGRHFWTTYTLPKTAYAILRAQWREGTLPSRRHLRRHGSECKPGL